MGQEVRFKADTETRDFLAFLMQWHRHQVAQLQMIVDENNKDASIDLNGEKIDPDSDLARGVRIGVSVALDLFESLPFGMEVEISNAE